MSAISFFDLFFGGVQKRVLHWGNEGADLFFDGWVRAADGGSEEAGGAV